MASAQKTHVLFKAEHVHHVFREDELKSVLEKGKRPARVDVDDLGKPADGEIAIQPARDDAGAAADVECGRFGAAQVSADGPLPQGDGNRRQRGLQRSCQQCQTDVS
jgi:hypothetical protein